MVFVFLSIKKRENYFSEASQRQLGGNRGAYPQPIVCYTDYYHKYNTTQCIMIWISISSCNEQTWKQANHQVQQTYLLKTKFYRQMKDCMTIDRVVAAFNIRMSTYLSKEIWIINSERKRVGKDGQKSEYFSYLLGNSVLQIELTGFLPEFVVFVF